MTIRHGERRNKSPAGTARTRKTETACLRFRIIEGGAYSGTKKADRKSTTMSKLG
jgi:hypothetical protein